MLPFLSIMGMATEALGLFSKAKEQLTVLKHNFDEAKAAGNLTEDQLGQLQAKLDEIHALNKELGAELDDTMAQLQARG